MTCGSHLKDELDRIKHLIFWDAIVNQCEDLRKLEQMLSELLSDNLNTLRYHKDAAREGCQVMAAGLTTFWMTSLRPGHSPPHVTTAAVTCNHRSCIVVCMDLATPLVAY